MTLLKSIPCRKCGGIIEYNGNYFCTECDWIMPEFHSDEDDEIIIAYLKQERDSTKDSWIAARMEFYLQQMGISDSK